MSEQGLRTRIYYRNKFLHIGHLQTLYYNDGLARKTDGVCYAIIDDRNEDCSILDIQEDFDYIGLGNTRLISVKEYIPQIQKMFIEYIRSRRIYLLHCNQMEQDPQIIEHFIANPATHFQLKYMCGTHPDEKRDISAGYTRLMPDGYLRVMYIFDFVVILLDVILSVTDVVTTSSGEQTFLVPGIRQHWLDTYYIKGFKYAKRDWPETEERNPCLLTIKGLKNRGVPPAVLYAFYIHGTQMGFVKISYLDVLLRAYLARHSICTMGVLHPLQVTIQNWQPKRTEYVCKQGSSALIPLSDVLYIEQSDVGLDAMMKGGLCRLRYGQNIKCCDIALGERSPTSMTAEYLDVRERDNRDYINWISSEWGQKPLRACFYLYSWFYTGNNQITEPQVSYGYIAREVFNDLQAIYYMERVGYFIYNAGLSAKEGIPTFLCIIRTVGK
jgi:hypothetical protein